MRRLERVSFVAGLVLLGWLIGRIGPARVGRNLADMGWGFALLVVLQAIPFLLATFSWRLMLPPGKTVPVMAMARMLVAGEAVNAVSPVALVGGELVRISLLSKRIPAEDAVPSVVLAATTQCCAQILFVLTGLPIALNLVHGAAVRESLVVFSAILAVFLGGLLFLGFSAAGHGWLRRAAARASWLRAVSQRVPPAWRDFLPRSLSAIRDRPRRFVLSVGASLLAWQMGAFETYLVLRFLHAPVGAARAYGIEVLAVAIEGAFFFVPARMGTQEGSKTLIFLAAGLDPAKGLALGLVRRIRELVWAGVGLGVLGAAQRSTAPVSPSNVRSVQTARLT